MTLLVVEASWFRKSNTFNGGGKSNSETFFVLVVGIILITKITPTEGRNRASVLSRKRDEVTLGRVIVRYLRRRERADLSADTEPSGIVRESGFRCGFDRRDDVDVDDAKEARDVEEMVTTGRGVRD